MKTKPLLIAASLAVGTAPALAQWAVIDSANLRQNVVSYAALIDQLENQARQIQNQLRQIEHSETQLRRMGDMAEFREVTGFVELRADLSRPSFSVAWAEGVAIADGRGLFGDSRGGVYAEVSADYPDFDGTTVERDPVVYRENHDIAVRVDEFKSVQRDVLTRREDLKRAIIETGEALQAAENEAEQRKLEAVLSAQYAQLAAVDAEVSLSAAAVQVKAAEAAAMGDARSKADEEARRHLAQQEARKLAATFQPRYESMLQYVSERRFSP